MENAWAFYRRSTDKQELSIHDQRRECRAYAAARGWHIAREFEPLKTYASGLTIERDPVFLEMVRLAESGGHGVQHLVVYDVSRFGRLQQEDKIYWDRRFKKQGGIQIAYVKDEFKNDGSIGDTILKVVKHSEAHQYSLKLSEVTLRGAKSHAALGHSTGGAAPFGFDRLEVDSGGNPIRIMNTANDWKSNKLHRVIWKPSPVNAPVVRKVFEMYDNGTGIKLIADHLNKQRMPAPRSRFWSKTMVHYMLRNRAYLGERIYNRRSYKAYRRGERAHLSNPRDCWVLKEGAHEAIVSRELFDRVQSRLKTKVVTIGRTFHRPYLLTGLARCSNCGYRMIGQPSSGNGHRYLTYTCSGYLRIGTTVCRSVHILAEALEEKVIASIVTYLRSPEWRVQVRETLAGMVAEEFGATANNKVDDLTRQLHTLEQQIANIVEAVKTSGRLSPAMNEALADLETQREAVRGDIASAETRTTQKVPVDDLIVAVMGYFAEFDRLWKQGLGLEERKELLRCYVHQIDVRHSATALGAEVWLYKIPVPRTQMTPALSGLEPIITRVNCGGRNLTLVKGIAKDMLPYVTSRTIALKQPYVHYRSTAA